MKNRAEQARERGTTLPPADQLQDWHDDVAGAAGEAADDPVAGVLLGRAGELPAAMGAVVGHKSNWVKITLLPNTVQDKRRFVEGLLSTAGKGFQL